jgi:hypothetical protein
VASAGVGVDPFGLGCDMRTKDGRKRFAAAVSSAYLDSLSPEDRKRLLRSVRRDWPSFRAFQSFRRPGRVRTRPRERRASRAVRNRGDPSRSADDDPEPVAAPLTGGAS